MIPEGSTYLLIADEDIKLSLVLVIRESRSENDRDLLYLQNHWPFFTFLFFSLSFPISISFKRITSLVGPN